MKTEADIEKTEKMRISMPKQIEVRGRKPSLTVKH